MECKKDEVSVINDEVMFRLCRGVFMSHASVGLCSAWHSLPPVSGEMHAHFQRPVELDPCDMMHFGRGEIKVLQGGFAMCHGGRQCMGCLSMVKASLKY